MFDKNNFLVHYDPDKPIRLITDASAYGVGAVLCHLVDGVEVPIYFASATLTQEQKNYSQFEREALTIIFCIRKFHLYGQKFEIITDAQVVEKLFGEKRSIPTLAAVRLQRWAIILSNYQYRIQYRHTVPYRMQTCYRGYR